MQTAMGQRSKLPETRAEVAKMPLERLNAEIQRCLYGWETGGSSEGRHGFFGRLVWYEKMREEIHGIPAPVRRSRRQR
jgi:hypothetical protein